MATSSLTNTGNQPYTTARVDYLASYMQTQLPGLSHDAAVKWIRAEQGVNGNVLGVTYRDTSGQHLYKYSSQEAGIRAAVSLIKTSGNYSGIRASLGQNVTAQLQAIAASPWNAPSHYNLGKTFGVTLPNVTGGSTSSGAASNIILTSAPGGDSGSTTGASLGAWGNTVAFPEGHIITNADVDTMVQALITSGLAPNDMAWATIRPILLTEVGQPWNKAMQDRLQQKFYAKAASMPTDVAGAVGAIGDAIVPQPLKDVAAVAGDVAAALFDSENWKYFGAIVVGLPLALIGFYLLAGVPTGGRNA